MDDRPFVYIVIVNWNGWQHTVRCLDSLRQLDYPNFRVIVVDNGSSDGSPERIRAAHPDTEVVEAEKNLGFGGGANIGIHKALDRGAEYVWVLNNDIEVEPATLSSLVSVARSRPGIGVIGAAVWRAAPDTEPSMHTEAFRWRGEYRLPSACPETGSANAAVRHPVDDVAGSSALLDAAMLRQIGPFEERFFHYWDDVEICARARSSGWSVEHACKARLWHVVGATVPTDSAQAQYYFVRNWLLFSRWAGRGNLLTMFRRAPRMTMGLIFARRWLLRGHWNVVVASLLGAFDAQRGRYGQRKLPAWLS
jgi:GT2 family glycosyltransferase